jgi:hypothetical protein
MLTVEVRTCYAATLTRLGRFSAPAAPNECGVVHLMPQRLCRPGP